MVGNQTGTNPARFSCGACWLKADPAPATDPLHPDSPFGHASCRKYCGKADLPRYTCAGSQCVVDRGGARVAYTDPLCFGPSKRALQSSWLPLLTP